MSRWYLAKNAFSLYIQLQQGTTRFFLKVPKSYATILVNGDSTFLGLYSYLSKPLTR